MAAKNEPGSASAEPILLVVQRTIDAPAELVFDAWLDPDSIRNWLFATPGGEMVRVEVDPRVGGEFIVFEKRGDMVAEHYGRYVEIDRPRRIVFLFAVEKFTEPNDDVSRVAIDIVPAGSGCEVTLTHEINPKWADYVERSRGGWTKILEKLDAMLKTKGGAMSAEPLVVEAVLNAPVGVVWDAITNKDGFKHWYFDVDDFKPQVGFQFKFAGEDKGITFIHHCQVKEVVPSKKLAYSWRYEGFEGDSLVTWELFPEDSGTRVRVTHAGLETFPKHPSFVRTNFEMGWTEIVGTLLKSFLEKQKENQ